MIRFTIHATMHKESGSIPVRLREYALLVVCIVYTSTRQWLAIRDAICRDSFFNNACIVCVAIGYHSKNTDSGTYEAELAGAFLRRLVYIGDHYSYSI